MKKSVRITGALLLVILCASLCGCDYLDYMRVSRASRIAEDTIRISDGTEYKLLPKCTDLMPEFDEGNHVYVAEAEVPLLLTDLYGEVFWKSDDGRFLEGDSEELGIYYCRTDLYDSILARIQNGFTPETYGYWYYTYEEGGRVFYMLTQEQADAVSQVYHTQPPEMLHEASSLNYTYMADLYQCTYDQLFMRDTINICVSKGKYYVVNYDLDTVVLYRVPDDLTPIFEKILQKEVESDAYWE